MATSNKRGKWKFSTDISWIIHNEEMGIKTKGYKINRALRGLAPFRNPEYRTLLLEMLEASSTEDEDAFEDALDNLYAFCDWFGVWLSA